MLRADAGHTTRLDLASVGDVAAKRLRVLVVDVLDVVLAELAVLATRLMGIFSHLSSSQIHSKTRP